MGTAAALLLAFSLPALAKTTFEGVVAKQKAEEKAQGIDVRDLVVPAGTSRVLTMPFAIGPIYQTSPEVFEFRRIRGEGDRDTMLIIVPKRAGITDITIHDDDAKVRMKYYVRVTPSTDKQAIEKQKAAEREEMSVVDLQLAVGVGRTIEFPFAVGPIYQTDPSRFRFTRIIDGEAPKKILLSPNRAGLSDLLVHDDSGKKRVKYYITVTGSGSGRPPPELTEPAPRQPAAALPNPPPVRFYDLIGEHPRPIF